MRPITEQLHRAFLRPLEDQLLAHTEIRSKPLDVDLELPLPRRLRIYMYSLVAGGKHRPGEYKAVLRVPGQRVGEYGGFDLSDNRFIVLAAYREDLDVFVLWDASLHPRFKHGGNIQVKAEVVSAATSTGWADQQRLLSSGLTELVFACRSSMLPKAIAERSSWTGGSA